MENRSPRPVLRLKGVTKDFGPKRAVNDISINVERGEIYGFLGPNGAGKTTTIRCIMDFISPTSGTVELFGQRLLANNAELKNRIGYLSADSALYPNWTGAEHINFVARSRGINPLNARELINKLSLDTSVKARRLSTGNRQKLSIVLALMHEPELLVLDEPTRGLDPLLQETMHNYLLEVKKQGGTVFISSHDFGEVERICDHIGIIRNGDLVANETIGSLRKMQVHAVKVFFASSFSKNDFLLPNVEITISSDRKLTANVSGDLTAFMRAVAKYDINDLEVTHVSLEDVFLRYYHE